MILFLPPLPTPEFRPGYSLLIGRGGGVWMALMIAFLAIVPLARAELFRRGVSP